jgi:MoaA/NifB/PqqE/SkfB family radical SAM enzyme
MCGPAVAFLVTNYDCNYRCKMCDLPERGNMLRNGGLKELTTTEMKDSIAELAKLGVSGIGFTGGEPLLRKDIFELIKYTKELGLIANFNTNGFYLDKENARALIESGIDSINISLDSADKHMHDSIRGCSGAFDKAIEAIGHINALRDNRRRRPRLKVVSVISERNVKDIPELLGLLSTLRVDCAEFIPEQPIYAGASGNTTYGPEFFSTLKKNIGYILKFDQNKLKIENSARHLKLFERSFKNERPPFRCYAGYNSYAMDCYGELYPCIPWVSLGKPAGNIKEMSAKDFWYSPKYDRIRDAVLKCKGCYLNCQAELNLLFTVSDKR